MGGELTEVDRQAGKRAQGSEVCVLASGLIGVIRKRLHEGRVVANELERVPRVDELEQRSNVEPLVGRPPQGPVVVEVEAVKVGDRPQRTLQTCRNRLAAVSRPTEKPQGWCDLNVGRLLFAVKPRIPTLRPGLAPARGHNQAAARSVLQSDCRAAWPGSLSHMSWSLSAVSPETSTPQRREAGVMTRSARARDALTQRSPGSRAALPSPRRRSRLRAPDR